MRRRFLSPLVAVAMLSAGGLACQTQTPQTTYFGTDSAPGQATDDNGVDTGASAATSASDEAGTVAPTSADPDDASPIKFDASVPDALAPVQSECTKVDFLFVIDNSNSMNAYQTNLVNSFPGFIDGIVGTLDTADSYQVGVVTTDLYFDNAAGCTGLSSLVTKTGGDYSSNAVCGPYANGFNFMTEADDLAESFSCAATVGTSGDSNEKPMQAMVEAAQRVQGGPDQCNEGFLRDDSLLIIVNIGDEYDNSPGTPTGWYDDIVAARSGIAENVVVLSIIDAPGNPCGFGESVDRAAFTALWGDNGLEVPICVPNYAPYFAQAVEVIDSACEAFVSPAG